MVTSEPQVLRIGSWRLAGGKRKRARFTERLPQVYGAIAGFFFLNRRDGSNSHLFPKLLSDGKVFDQNAFFFFRTPLSESPSPVDFFPTETGVEFFIQHRVNCPAVQVLHWLVFQQLGSAMTLQWFRVNEPGVRRVGSYVFGC